MASFRSILKQVGDRVPNLPLLEKIVCGQPGNVILELAAADSGPVWCVDLKLVSV